MITLILTACQATVVAPAGTPFPATAASTEAKPPPPEVPNSTQTTDPLAGQPTTAPTRHLTSSSQPPCSQPPCSSTPGAPALPQAATPTAGGIALVGLLGQPDSLNPIIEHNPALQELAPLLFDTLLRADPQSAALQPGLARSWEYSGDGRQVLFHLPPNLKWSDGASMTAADIADSLRATEHPALLAFSDIDAPDRDTLALTFSAIDCAAVSTLAQLPLLPSAQITAALPTGSGPFTVQEWSADKRSLTLTQNSNHHGPTPFLEGLTIRFIRESDIPLALSEGNFDLIGPLQAGSDLQPAITAPPPPFTGLTYPAPQVIYLAINFDPRNETALEPEVRQALPLALDREALLAEALGGDGQLLPGSLLPGHWAAPNGLRPPDYDPETARTLLAGAGLRDEDGDGWLDQNGERLELSIRLNGQNRLHQELGWLISGYYREVGLLARAEGVPSDSLIDDLFTHDFRLALFSWPLLPEPDQRLFWRSTENSEGIGLNFTSYDSPALDDLLDQAVAGPGCQPQARAEIYANVQETLVEDGPVDFLLTPNRHVWVANRLRGVEPGPFAPLGWNVAAWYLVGE